MKIKQLDFNFDSDRENYRSQYVLGGNWYEITKNEYGYISPVDSYYKDREALDKPMWQVVYANARHDDDYYDSELLVRDRIETLEQAKQLAQEDFENLIKSCIGEEWCNSLIK